MTRGIVAAAVAAMAATFVAGATPASALSCVSPPPDAPRIAAENGEVYGAPFFDEFDFAVVATVTGIETDETSGSDTYGATTIDADVALVLGDAEATETIQLSAGDPGWMTGYPFEVGQSYFVPVEAVGPSGQVNHTFVCTPITEVADAGATAVRLAALADESGVAHAQAGDEEVRAAPSATPATTDETSSSSTWLLVIAGVVLLAVAGVVSVVIRHRRAASVDPT